MIAVLYLDLLHFLHNTNRSFANCDITTKPVEIDVLLTDFIGKIAEKYVYQQQGNKQLYDFLFLISKLSAECIHFHYSSYVEMHQVFTYAELEISNFY